MGVADGEFVGQQLRPLTGWDQNALSLGVLIFRDRHASGGEATMSSPSVNDVEVEKPRHPSFWIIDLPFFLVLVLTVIGVAYTSFSNRPIILYWELLAPMIGLVCVGAGWHHTTDSASRWRLIATQGLHWLAFLLVMNLLLLPSVQRLFNSSAIGLAIFVLLTLGTFTAGVHVLSWQVLLLGLVMALSIPAIAFIQTSSLMVAVIGGAIAMVVAVVWWHWRAKRPSSQSDRG